ncbi:MAG: Fur family transcriptional regulator [Eubacteriales bacterium]|nr:Fur family transcriptional regulator [Eubacteriales bacterium]
MTKTIEDFKKILQEKNIRLSHQRLKVLEYLVQNKTHPSVDDIYINLQKDLSSLSKATVYNTLNMLEEVGLVNVLTIEDNENHYEITSKNHGHFKCTSCKKIYDFTLDVEEIKSTDLADFEIKERDVYFRGLCPECLDSDQDSSDK